MGSLSLGQRGWHLSRSSTVDTMAAQGLVGVRGNQHRFGRGTYIKGGHFVDELNLNDLLWDVCTVEVPASPPTFTGDAF